MLAQLTIAESETLDAYGTKVVRLLGHSLMPRGVSLRGQLGSPPMAGNDLLGYMIDQKVLCQVNECP